MSLDSFTVLVASCAALAILGLALLYFWVLDRSSKWLLWWALPFLMGAGSIFPYMRPHWEGDFVAIGLGNAVRIVAIGLLWQGARVFGGRKPVPLALLLAAGLWLGLSAYPPFFDSMAARIVGASLFNCAICALAAFELWRDRDEVLASRRPAIVVLLAFSAAMLARAVTVNILPFPMGALPLDPTVMAVFNLLVFSHAYFLGFLLIGLTKERREAEQRHFASLDPLTGLMNRRAFMSHADRLSRRHKPGGEPAALLVLDLDHFKAINDRFGHDVGDRVLVAFAAVAESCVRPTDQLYRMGGEEFCFILPDTGLADALIVADAIRSGFERQSVKAANGRASATVSIGVAVAEHPGSDLELMLSAADAAVYEAKARGRNRVVVADPLALLRAGPVREPALEEQRRSA